MIDINERYSEKRNFFKRLLFVYIFFGILFLYLIYKTFSLQVSSFTDYELASLENKTREFLVQPRRGIIYDRNGKIIVNNKPSYNLILNPERVDDINKLISEINKFINLSDAEIKNINDSFPNKKKLNREVVVKRNLTQEEIARFEVRNYKFPNVQIAERYTRENLYPYLFSHSIGYVGNLDEDELREILLSQGLKSSETIFTYSGGFLNGKTGVEYIYDEKLRGSFGKKIYEVDASGRLLEEQQLIPAIDGENIITSLDLPSQKVAYDKLNFRRGAVVAVDINNGAIVTYVSSPSFSVNKIANGLSQKEFNELINDDNKPFFHPRYILPSSGNTKNPGS